MEIRFYTPELNLIGVMENQTSLLWTRKFYEPGNFQLTTPITDYNVKLCQLGNIISIDGADEAAVIECVTIRQEHTRRIITAVGRMLSSYFDRRLIRPLQSGDSATYKFNGTIEGAMRELVTRFGSTIPLVQLGIDNEYDETIVFQATYKNLLTYLTKLSKAGNIGYRLVPDFTQKTLTFESYKGLDHSVKQSERIRVEFSEGFQNISTLKYQEDDRNYKNTFYMRDGNGNYSMLGYDEHEGLDRREVLDTSYGSEDLTMYVYNEPQFLETLPTTKLKDIAVYTTDTNRPLHVDRFHLKDESGNDVYVEEELTSPAKTDPVTGYYGPYWTSSYQWVAKTPYGGLFTPFNKSYSLTAAEGFGLTVTRDGQKKDVVASNPYDQKTGYTYIGYEQKIAGYGMKFSHYREETDAEFQARVDAYWVRFDAYQKQLLEYQEQYSMDLAAYKVRENSFYQKYRKIINFECVVNPNGNFKYKRDYDLGDIVTVKKDVWEIEYDLRVTEVQEIYEHGLMMVALVLGDVMPETIDWEDT